MDKGKRSGKGKGTRGERNGISFCLFTCSHGSSEVHTMYVYILC